VRTAAPELAEYAWSDGQREIVDRLGANRQNSETITRTIDRMIGRLHERFGISADVLVRGDAEGAARPAR
jgi:hypothetical protein